MKSGLIETPIDGLYLGKKDFDICVCIVDITKNRGLEILKNKELRLFANNNGKFHTLTLNSDTYLKVILKDLEHNTRIVVFKNGELFYIEPTINEYKWYSQSDNLDLTVLKNISNINGYTTEDTLKLIDFIGLKVDSYNLNIIYLTKYLGVIYSLDSTILAFIQDNKNCKLKFTGDARNTSISIGYKVDKELNKISSNLFLGMGFCIDGSRYTLVYKLDECKLYLHQCNGSFINFEVEVCECKLENLLVGDLKVNDDVITVNINKEDYNIQLK